MGFKYGDRSRYLLVLAIPYNDTVLVVLVISHNEDDSRYCTCHTRVALPRLLRSCVGPLVFESSIDQNIDMVLYLQRIRIVLPLY